MSRKKRRKKLRKGESRLTPEDRVLQNLSDGCWWLEDQLQRKSSVKKVVVRRVLGSVSVDKHTYQGNIFYRLQDEDKLVDDIDYLDSFVRSFSSYSVGHIVDAVELHRIYSGFARSGRAV